MSFTPEFLALKAANDRLREQGRLWLWETIQKIGGELNRDLSTGSDQTALQIARQEWQFNVEQSVMAGERIGMRYRACTLTVEIGWPRLPEHGFVPDNGLARARIALSQNVMLEARAIDELILKKLTGDDPAWYLIANKKLGDRITESHLRQYLNLILSD